MLGRFGLWGRAERSQKTKTRSLSPLSSGSLCAALTTRGSSVNQALPTSSLFAVAGPVLNDHANGVCCFLYVVL